MTCPVCSKEHFGLCHHCTHNADVQAGKFKDVPWDKTPCSGCKLYAEDVVLGHGDFISADADNADDVDRAIDNAAINRARIEQMLADDMVIRSVQRHIPELDGADMRGAFYGAMKLVHWFMDLPTFDRIILYRRCFRGESYEQIVSYIALIHRTNISVQAAHARMVALLKHNNLAKLVARHMIAKQERKQHARAKDNGGRHPRTRPEARGTHSRREGHR